MGSKTSMLGYRFHPSDEELVAHYLNHMLHGKNSTVHNIIAEIDVCKFEPWHLPAFSKVKSDDQEWFFFSPVALKLTKDTRNRCNRKTKAGFWKPTGTDRKIKSRDTNNIIGIKKTLVFYEGRSSCAVKTNWVMHEYHALTFPEDKIWNRGFVLCRLINKAERGTDTLIHDEGETSSHIAADFEERIPNVSGSILYGAYQETDSMPVGYRFHPYDEELTNYYLKHKLLGNDSTVHNVIAEIDVCKFEPWELPAFSKVKSDDQEWFFFSPLCLKLTKNTKNRCNRKTEAGYWKLTGKDRNIKIRGTNNVIGTKKTLVFYKGRSSHGVKTNWVIHEYHAAATFPEDKVGNGFVLCRLMNKAEKKAETETDKLIHDAGESSSHIAADFGNQEIEDRIQNVYTLPEVNLESIFQTPPQEEEYDFTSLQQSTIGIEQEPSSQVSSFPNEYLGEKDNLDNIYIDKFLNEILAGEDAFISNETMPDIVIETIPTLKKAYNERDTDSEPLSGQVKITSLKRDDALYFDSI